MRYIKEYNEYQINEKISWYEMLLILGLAYFGGKSINKNVKIHNQLNSIYQDINSPKSEPSGEELKQVELIRSELIEKVSKQNRFKDLNQSWIIDSLKKIHFKIIDDMLVYGDGNGVRGCYIYLPSFKKGFPLHHKILSAPNIDNVIIINRSSLKDEDFSDVIVHELYHYVDKLIGDGTNDMSDKSNITKFLDTYITKDSKYAAKKLAVITGYEITNINDLKELEKILSNSLSTDRYRYLSSSQEIFSRWKTFKIKLLDKGYISDINKNPSIDDIGKYFYKEREKITDSDIVLMMILDWTRFEELDNAIN